MRRHKLQEAINRIGRMEASFDMLCEAVHTDPAAVREDASLSEVLRMLIEYYEGGQWLHDYELDEKGLLPSDLKRGVLAQDAVYDLLEQVGDAGR